MYDDLHFHYATYTHPPYTHTHTHTSITGSWTQALKRVLESVYSYFSYDVNTYIASSLSRSPPATEAAATVNESSEDTSMHYGGRSLPVETNNSDASNSRRFHHGSSSSSSDDCSTAVARSSGGRSTAASGGGGCASPSLEDSRWSDQSSSSSRKQPNKSISSFTVENILMGRQRLSSSSDSPTTTMSESFSATPPPSSSTSGISISTVSSNSGSGGSSSNHSSVVGTNWVSHPPVKYTKFTMLSPTSMADETQKKKKIDNMVEVQWRDSGSQEIAQGSLSSSFDHGRELRRVPSNLRGSMDLPTSFPVTQKPKSFSRSSSSGTPSSFFHKISAASSSNSQSQQQNFPTQSILQTATKVSALPVVQAIPTAPDAKAAVLHQTFPHSGQQVVLLIPSNSTSIAGSIPTIFYANPVLSLSQSGTTTSSPAGVTKVSAVTPISTTTAIAYSNNSASGTSQGSDLGRVSPPSSVHKRHTAIDDAAQPPHNQQLSETPHRPIAPKITTTMLATTTPTAAAAPQESVDSKNSDKMKLYLKRTMPKPPKLRFHMTTVMKQPTGNTVMTSLTAQSPQAVITGEPAGTEHGGSLSENEQQQHLRSEVAVESTITRSPNVYSNEGTPSHKQLSQQQQRVVIAAATAPWTTPTQSTAIKQEPAADSDDGSSPTQSHSPQTNGAVNLTTLAITAANSSTITATNSKNGTISANKTPTPQTAVLKDSGFHLQLVKQQSGGGAGDVNTSSPPQPQLQNAASKEQETSSGAHSAVQKSGRQNGRQSGPGRGRGRATRSYTRRKRELTFHLYEDPSTAFRAKRQCRDKE